ncbi:hypothetical protein ACEXOS_022145 [Herbiconiux sp. P16]|uniref:hypothetical protein n=1 Tax=Herbiconiux wuyangfengii TaxID=3342794 RepID=UPI003CF7A4AB
MARLTNSELAALVEQLQAENERLREDARLADTLPIETESSSEPAGRRRSGRRRGRTVASVVLVVIGLILAPVAVAANWTQSQLANTEAFVSTFAPLAKDPAVRAFVIDEVMTAVEEQVDFEKTTSDVFDAVDQLGLPPAASAALTALKKPAALGLQSLATTVVTNFVESPAFADIWEQALRVSHQQLVAAMTNDPAGALSISSSGELSVQLGPIIEAVKTAMINQGLSFADAIPTVDMNIVVAKSDSFGQLTLAYGLAVSLGMWLPWIAIAFLAAGVVAAKRRTVALFWTGLSLGVLMVLLGIALRIGNLITVASIAPQYVPIDAAGVIYDAVTSMVASTVVAVAVLAFTVMVISWAVGPYRPAPALRRAFGDAATKLRAVGDARGISTGAFGRVLGKQRVLIQVLIGVAAAAFILFLRPLSTGQIIWTAVIAVILLLLVELLQRPVLPEIVVVEVAEEPEAEEPEGSAEKADDDLLIS